MVEAALRSGLDFYRGSLVFLWYCAKNCALKVQIRS